MTVVRRLFALTFICAALLAVAPFGGEAAAASAREREARPARIGDYFSDADLARARRYRGPRYLLTFASIAVAIAALAVLFAASRRLGEWSERVAGGRWWVQALLLATIVTLVPRLATLPLGIAQWRHNRSYGLATNSIWGYLSDAAKAIAFQVVVAMIAALIFLWIVRALPRGWPLVTIVVGGLLSVVMVLVFPVIYEPLFNRFRPVDASTRARVLALAERTGVRVNDVLVADASRRTTRQNAYVSGIGGTRRVVLYDTLLEKSPPREVDLVVAHELAHEAHNDVLKGTLLGIAGLAAGIAIVWWMLRWGAPLAHAGAQTPGDPRLIPFLALFFAVVNLVALPATNALSRRMEASADRTAIETTRDPGAAIALEVNLARGNLADLEPNAFIRWAFFSHPPVLERIQIALDHKATRS